jgi:hypothetical protein
MTPQEIAEHVSTSNLLTPVQLVAVYNYLCTRSMRFITIFSDKPRKTEANNTNTVIEEAKITQNSVSSNSEPVNPNVSSEQSLFDDSNSSISTVLVFPTSTDFTETDGDCSTSLNSLTLRDGTNSVKDLSTSNSDPVDIPLSEVEFIMPMDPPRRRGKKSRKFIVSPPSSGMLH